MPVEGRGLGSRQTQQAVRDREIGQPNNSETCSEAADGVTRESEGRKPVIASMPCTTRSAVKTSWRMPMPVPSQGCTGVDADPCRTGHRSDNRLLPSLSRVTPSAASEHVSELLGCPISRSLTACCVCLEQGPFPPPALPGFSGTTSPSATLARPAVPHGRPVRSSLITHKASRVARAFLCTCCRHYPGAADGRSLRSSHPTVSAFPVHVRIGLHIVLFEAAQRSLAFAAAHSHGHRMS